MWNQGKGNGRMRKTTRVWGSWALPKDWLPEDRRKTCRNRFGEKGVTERVKRLHHLGGSSI